MNLFQVILHNMTLVISYIYVSLLYRNYTIRKKGKTNRVFHWLYPILAGILSLLVMTQPFRYQDMIFDIRSLPIFFISYLGGWKWGLLSIFIPSIYRVYLGGPSVYQAIFIGMFLPVVIGHYFNRRRNPNRIMASINIHNLLSAFMFYSFFKFLLGYMTVNVDLLFWIKYNVLAVIFSSISLFIASLILNEANTKLSSENELKYLSNHDSMTKLANRRYCTQEAKKIIESHIPLAVAMLDIDHFKQYNDTNGHMAGDEVLIRIADIFRSAIRKDDLVARYGGEEFIILFKNMGRDQVLSIAERIRESVESYRFKGEETQPKGMLTISIGISLSSGDKSMQQLIEEADKALYQSKNTGRNKVSIY